MAHLVINSKEWWEDHHKTKRWDRKLDWALQIVVGAVPHGGRVMMAGCAQGEEVFFISRARPDLHLIGTDFSFHAIKAARKHLAEIKSTHPGEPGWEKIAFEQADIIALHEHYVSCFDYVTAIETIEHLPIEKQDPAARTLLSLLKPGGKLLITLPGPKAGAIPEHEKDNFTEAEVYEWFVGRCAAVTFHRSEGRKFVIVEVTK
jgi:2-polyprenyl-3-methyl-5-hydroxy-6-metoxy-1,4-benzoquinol methylase